MDLISIGDAGRTLGLNTSALRYYDDRGLVRPATRQGGRRLYGQDELRRLALIKIMQGLGLNLEAAAAILDQPGNQWRATARTQLTELEHLIARAKGAQTFLEHAIRCPANHPARDCPVMTKTLDRIIAGLSLEQLAAEHANPS
jgi:DNA-binding transcriptional MerR regulator